MRSTTIVYLIVAGWALLSQSPATYAAAVGSQVNSAGEKRFCKYYGCRIEELPNNNTVTNNTMTNNTMTNNTMTMTQL